MSPPPRYVHHFLDLIQGTIKVEEAKIKPLPPPTEGEDTWDAAPDW